jgi:hypothetical protein
MKRNVHNHRGFGRAIGIAVVLLGLSLPTARTTYARFGDCDVSGAYTDRLCDGEHLAPSEYLVSSNGDFRFYYQADGHAAVYDFRYDEEGEYAYTVMFPDYFEDDPGKFQHGLATWAPSGCQDFAWTIFDDNNDVVAGSSTCLTPSGDHYTKLDNNGCLATYDATGMRGNYVCS